MRGGGGGGGAKGGTEKVRSFVTFFLREGFPNSNVKEKQIGMQEKLVNGQNLIVLIYAGVDCGLNHCQSDSAINQSWSA